MRSLRIRTFTMRFASSLSSYCRGYSLLLRTLWKPRHSASNKVGRKTRPCNEIYRKMTRRIESDTDQWTDPVWQNQLYSALREAKMDVLIQSAEDREIYRSNPDRRGTNLSTERFSVIEDGQLGRVILYLPKSNQFQVMSAFVGCCLRSLLSAWK